MPIIRDIFTLDILLHSILGFALMGSMWAMTQEADWTNYARFSAMILYLRELGQVQGRYYDNNFLKGWTLAGADPDRAFHRHMEWIAPSVVINWVTVSWLV